MDLTVASIPVYFGTMAAERRYLQARAAERGPTAGGLHAGGHGHVARHGGRLAARADRHAQAGAAGRPRQGPVRQGLVAWGRGCGRGHGGRRRSPTGSPARRRPRRKPDRPPAVGRMARRVRRVTAPVAVAAGTLAVSTSFATRTNPDDAVGEGQARATGETACRRGPAAIAGWDFIYYWNHRFMHEVRGMWAIHVVHHSSERYNLSTALRQPVADVLGVWVPYGAAGPAGVRPTLVSQARAINLLYQYWIHTETIGRSARPRRCSTRRRTPGAPRLEPPVPRPQPRLDPHRLGQALRHVRARGRDGGLRADEEHRLVQPRRGRQARVPRHRARHRRLRPTGGTGCPSCCAGPGWAYERHRQLAAEGDAIVDEPGPGAITAA